MDGEATAEHSGTLAAAPPGAGGGNASALPGMLMAMGITLIAGVLLYRARRVRARAGTRTSSKDRVEQVQAEFRARATLDALMVEMQEQTRLCAAQIENRAVRLEKLIALADERIAALQTAAHPEGPRPQGPAEPIVTATVLHKPALDPLTRQVYELADEGRPSVQIARELDETIGKVDLILSLRRA